MRDNTSNISGATVDTPHSIHEEQEAYDLLDPRVRKFIGQLPEKMSAVWALKMQRTRGVEALLASGKVMLEKRYPGFKPL